MHHDLGSIIFELFHISESLRDLTEENHRAFSLEDLVFETILDF